MVGFIIGLLVGGFICILTIALFAANNDDKS